MPQLMWDYFWNAMITFHQSLVLGASKHNNGGENDLFRAARGGIPGYGEREQLWLASRQVHGEEAEGKELRCYPAR